MPQQRKSKKRPRSKKQSPAQPASSRKHAAALDRERVRRRTVEQQLRDLRQQHDRTAAIHKRKTKELLDGLLQSLYGVGLGLEVTRTLIGVNPRQANHELAQSTLQLNNLIQRIRAFVINRDSVWH